MGSWGLATHTPGTHKIASRNRFLSVLFTCSTFFFVQARDPVSRHSYHCEAPIRLRLPRTVPTMNSPQTTPKKVRQGSRSNSPAPPHSPAPLPLEEKPNFFSKKAKSRSVSDPIVTACGRDVQTIPPSHMRCVQGMLFVVRMCLTCAQAQDSGHITETLKNISP